MKVGIQGIEGSFHHQAALEFFGENQDIEIVSFDSFERLYEALAIGAIDRAMAAVENNLYGTINESFDLMLKYRTAIVGEIYLHVSFHLLGTLDATLEGITDVYSQAPALGECKAYLKRELPWARLHEYSDTALSAKFVMDQNKKTNASIASDRARKKFGLQSLDSEIEDHKNNYTRFFVLAKDQQVVIDADKTSMIIKTDHSSGALHRALGAFAANDINLGKIESRPIAGKQWNYIFYLDAQAGHTTIEMKNALAKLSKQKVEVTVLGTYVRSPLPEIL